MQELLHLRQVNALLKKQTAAAASAAEAAAVREAAARQALRAATALTAANSSSNEVSPNVTLRHGALPTQVRVNFQYYIVHCL
jgi:hypothetical protein